MSKCYSCPYSSNPNDICDRCNWHDFEEEKKAKEKEEEEKQKAKNGEEEN